MTGTVQTPDETTSREQEQLTLVDKDHERTTGFIEAVLSRSTTLREFAITIWLAVLGFGLQQDEWSLALLASVVVWAFAYLDVTTSVLYARALRHERAIESVRRQRYRALQRREYDPEADLEFREALEDFRYGLVANLGPVRLADVREARPANIFTRFYPALTVIAAGCAVALAVT
jgi:hypothetical protein